MIRKNEESPYLSSKIKLEAQEHTKGNADNVVASHVHIRDKSLPSTPDSHSFIKDIKRTKMIREVFVIKFISSSEQLFCEKSVLTDRSIQRPAHESTAESKTVSYFVASLGSLSDALIRKGLVFVVKKADLGRRDKPGHANKTHYRMLRTRHLSMKEYLIHVTKKRRR